MKKVLIVDDEAAFTRLMALNLEDTGEFEVRVENSPEQATRTATYFKPDVVVLDILMPGKSGIKLAEEWQQHATLSTIPVIFLTAAMSKDSPVIEHGVLEKFPVLIKPVSFTDLLKQLTTAIGS